MCLSDSVPSEPSDDPRGSRADARDDQESTENIGSFHRTSVFVEDFGHGRRQRARLDAEEIRTLDGAMRAAVEVRDEDVVGRLRSREVALRSLIAELAVCGSVSEYTVARLMNEAVDLCTRFEAGVVALEAGEITRRHLAVLHQAGMLIEDDADRSQFMDAALRRARDLTPARLSTVARVLAERYLPRTADERHTAAAESRGVRVEDLADAMADLILRVPAVLAHGIYDRATRQARTVIDARDPDEDLSAADVGAPPVDARTMDQIRADVLTDLLLTATTEHCSASGGIASIHATVQITVPVLTMTGITDDPCLLTGYGPIDPDSARELAARAPAWERVMTHPLTGAVLAVDRYRPSQELRRFLRARDEHCRFPGCRRPEARCDIDHTLDAARGGPTGVGNLAHLCRRHHTLKHHSAWTVRQEPGGVLVWTSPSGRDHTDLPEPTVRFTPDDRVTARRRSVHHRWLFPGDDPLPAYDPGLDPSPF